MIKVMNSSMMPTVGVYKYEEISFDKFKGILTNNTFESFIGYKETAEVLSEATGVEISYCRDNTKVLDGDILLVAKLRNRFANTDKKGVISPSIDDFTFYKTSYSLANEPLYFVIYSEFCSGDESSIGTTIAEAYSIDEARMKWQGLFETDCDEYETSYGNLHKLHTIKPIPYLDFEVLKKYLTVI